MKKNKKEELNKECNCDETCTCGCQDGLECTCDSNCDESCDCGCHEGEECTCEEENVEDEGCSGHCDGCAGCGGSYDPDTAIQILTVKNYELEEKFMRLQAEYLNYKTRTQGEVSRMLKYEGEEFIKQILSIKDNMERAIMMDNNDLSDEVSKFLSGFKMILGNLNNILENFEVKEVECLGMEFDPNVADAVLTDHNEEKPENVVLEVLTKGYKYKDKLIRPAMVKVNK